MMDILIAIFAGAVPNFLFAYGTGHAIKSKSIWPAVFFIISGFAAYSFGIWLARKGYHVN